jgi:hypothetical protein
LQYALLLAVADAVRNDLSVFAIGQCEASIAVDVNHIAVDSQIAALLSGDRLQQMIEQ